MVTFGSVIRRQRMHDSEDSAADGQSMLVDNAAIGGAETFVASIEGINGDTITFEATVNGTDWYAFKMTNVTSETAATTATADGIYRGNCIGYTLVRARISTYSAGSITVEGRLAS